jgi:hypothetical protein
MMLAEVERMSERERRPRNEPEWLVSARLWFVRCAIVALPVGPVLIIVISVVALVRYHNHVLGSRPFIGFGILGWIVVDALLIRWAASPEVVDRYKQKRRPPRR